MKEDLQMAARLREIAGTAMLRGTVHRDEILDAADLLASPAQPAPDGVVRLRLNGRAGADYGTFRLVGSAPLRYGDWELAVAPDVAYAAQVEEARHRGTLLVRLDAAAPAAEATGERRRYMGTCGGCAKRIYGPDNVFVMPPRTEGGDSWRMCEPCYLARYPKPAPPAPAAPTLTPWADLVKALDRCISAGSPPLERSSGSDDCVRLEMIDLREDVASRAYDERQAQQGGAR